MISHEIKPIHKNVMFKFFLLGGHSLAPRHERNYMANQDIK